MVTKNWEDVRGQLVDTYRTLNIDFRPKGEDVLAAGHNGESVKSILRELREHEFRFAKALTENLTGIVMGDDDDPDESPTIGKEVPDESAAVLISQFGNARATTLNTLHTADDEAWDRPIVDNKKLLDLSQELAESDRAYLDRMRRLAGA